MNPLSRRLLSSAKPNGYYAALERTVRGFAHSARCERLFSIGGCRSDCALSADKGEICWPVVDISEPIELGTAVALEGH